MAEETRRNRTDRLISIVVERKYKSIEELKSSDAFKVVVKATSTHGKGKAAERAKSVNAFRAYI